MALKIYNDLQQQILCFLQICRFLPTKTKYLAMRADPAVLDAKHRLSRGHPLGNPVFGASYGYAHSI
jgi:hypothetical protein